MAQINADLHAFVLVQSGTRERPEFKLIHTACQKQKSYVFSKLAHVVQDAVTHQCPVASQGCSECKVPHDSSKPHSEWQPVDE
jgi:hypothetical protein